MTTATKHLIHQPESVAPEAHGLGRAALFISCAFLLAAFAIWGSPFLLDYLNSGDQLPPLLQAGARSFGAAGLRRGSTNNDR
ncbi:MAG TPA: hypothetical protein PLD20_35365, partial [Blastocatellia bacterium]|nr:hypothetical protein [Blastocatellia bacterium]